MILKNILRRKGRTFLTVLGVSVGIAAIVGLYVATMRWQELTTGKDILEDPSETVH